MSQTKQRCCANFGNVRYTRRVLNDVDVKEDSRVTIAVLLSLCFNVGLFTILLILRQQNLTGNEEINLPNSLGVQDGWLKNAVCVECRVLGISPDDVSFNKDVSFLSLSNAQLCCLSKAETLLKLFELLVMKSMMNVTNTQSIPVPSAHLYLDSLQDNNYIWSVEYGFGAAHVTRPILFREGRLIIEKPGLYNIYSFITLKRKTYSSTPTTISHSIRRISSHRQPSTDVILQTGVQLPRHSETFTTSYLSGLVHLQSQDELYVDVSHIEHVYRYAPSNFFGLHLVQYLS